MLQQLKLGGIAIKVKTAKLKPSLQANFQLFDINTFLEGKKKKEKNMTSYYFNL